ncbi:MAG: DUF3299 domain-containing protein [Pseudomonadota bacterium]
MAVPVQAVDLREITWLMLMPKDWNPRARLGDRRLEELDDNDPKAQQVLREMRAVLDAAPTVTHLDGAVVKLPGYIVPLEQTKDGLTEFLLVPYYGACIHTPPPPANQIVHVKSSKAWKDFDPITAVWVTGTLKASRRDSGVGVSGYALDLAKMEVYRGR